jgi:hypothetical protein
MEQMVFRGRLVEIFPVKSGTSKAGKDWKSVDFMLESEGQYPKQAAFNLYGDKIDYITKYSIGTLLDVKFSLESKLYNGNVFTKASAYAVSPVQSETQTYASGTVDPKEVSIKDQIMEQKANEPDLADEGNDLPF